MSLPLAFAQHRDLSHKLPSSFYQIIASADLQENAQTYVSDVKQVWPEYTRYPFTVEASAYQPLSDQQMESMNFRFFSKLTQAHPEAVVIQEFGYDCVKQIQRQIKQNAPTATIFPAQIVDHFFAATNSGIFDTLSAFYAHMYDDHATGQPSPSQVQFEKKFQQMVGDPFATTPS